MLRNLFVGLFVLLCTLPGLAQGGQEPLRVHSLQFSPDGKLLVVSLLKGKFDVNDKTSVIKPGELQVWEVGSGRLKWSVPIQVLLYKLPQILFSPDSSVLLATNLVTTTVAPQHTPDFPPSENPAISTVPIQQTQSILWNAATGEKRGVLEVEPRDLARTLTFSPDGHELVGGIYGNSGRRSEAEARAIHVWNPRTGKLLRRTPLGESTPEFMAFSQDGRSLKTLSPERTEHSKSRIMRWESWSWPEGRMQEGHLLPAPLGRLFVPLTPEQGMARLWMQISFFANQTYLWDIESRSLKELPLPRGPVWDINTFQLLPDRKTLVGHVIGVMSFDAKDGDMLYQDYLRFWDKETGQVSRTLKVGEVQKAVKRDNYPVAYTPDGQQFVISLPTGKIELRSLEDGALIRNFE